MREDVNENTFKNSSERPIYEQIKQQVKENILKGYVAPGEHLPSMRELAQDLSVSVITTKRAYEDLEKDGFVFTIRGKGTFVKEQDSSILKEKQFIVIESLAKSMSKEAKTIGMTLSELQEILALIYEEDDE
ncbi:PSM export ABC transporter transcriptional regulator PmtR [Staphylococcus ureilyticus]|uniref:PSM export ABC transporter transcriptional regulator PmtR n=1 Tax=Staphylococcus ureilyticus TaxID=94138 RepID=UPI0034DD4667